MVMLHFEVQNQKTETPDFLSWLQHSALSNSKLLKFSHISLLNYLRKKNGIVYFFKGLNYLNSLGY